MKKTILTLLMTAAAVAGRGDVTLLERSARPCHELDAEVWVVTDLEPSAMPASYTTYGDSLLAEAVDGRRMWYELRGDSALFVREETALMEIVPDRSPIAWLRGAATSTGEQPLTARGAYSQFFKLAEDGSMEAFAPRAGTLVAAPGDSVRATMRRERRRFKAFIGATIPEFPFGAGGDTLPVFEVERTRWYTAASDLIPVAVQTDTRVFSPDGRLIDESSTAYIVPAYQLVQDELDRQADSSDPELASRVAGAMAGASVACESGKVTITLNPGEGAAFTVVADITDEGGILYRHEESPVDGPTTMEISTAGLAWGRYLVTLSSPATPATEKKLVIIR